MKTHFKNFYLGICAGVSIAFGGLLNIIAVFLLNNTPFVGRLAGSLLFPIGLTLVCFLGFNLFTGKIGYVFDNNKSYLPFLLIIYIGNFAGAFVFGGLCLICFKNLGLYQTALSIGNGKCLSFDFLKIIKTFAGSVLCGALVYIAVYCYKVFPKKWQKILGIFIPIALFVFLKFDHCIANMFYFTFAWKFNCFESWLNIIVVTFGNSFGAIIFNFIIKSVKSFRNK